MALDLARPFVLPHPSHPAGVRVSLRDRDLVSDPPRLLSGSL
jgi:hypothetical protein